MKLRTLLAASAFMVAVATATTAAAHISILTDECNQGCTNVHLIPEANPDLAPTKSYGETDQGSGIDVIFTGIEAIKTSADGNGLPWVTALDGTTTFLDIAVEDGYSFTKLGFNLNESNAAGNPSWVVKITGFDQFGATNQLFQLSSNTKFTVLATDGQYMTHVAIQLMDGVNPADENGIYYDPPGQGASNATKIALDGVGQVKIGGVAAIVPEPSTWALMITGFGGAGAMLRRRRTAFA